MKTKHDSVPEENGVAPVATWLSERMPDPVSRAIDRPATCPDVARIAVMPDVHLGPDVCNGVVVATRSCCTRRPSAGTSAAA